MLTDNELEALIATAVKSTLIHLTDHIPAHVSENDKDNLLAMLVTTLFAHGMGISLAGADCSIEDVLNDILPRVITVASDIKENVEQWQDIQQSKHSPIH